MSNIRDGCADGSWGVKKKEDKKGEVVLHRRDCTNVAFCWRVDVLGEGQNFIVWYFDNFISFMAKYILLHLKSSVFYSFCGFIWYSLICNCTCLCLFIWVMWNYVFICFPMSHWSPGFVSIWFVEGDINKILFHTRDLNLRLLVKYRRDVSRLFTLFVDWFKLHVIYLLLGQFVASGLYYDLFTYLLLISLNKILISILLYEKIFLVRIWLEW